MKRSLTRVTFCIAGGKARGSVRRDETARDQILDMREHCQRRRPVQARVDALVDWATICGMVSSPSLKPLQDRRLALGAVMREGAQIALRIAHGPAMRRPVERVIAPPQLFDRLHIVAHGAVGRRHHGRRPGHHMIAGKQRALLAQRETKMIGGVAGSCDGLDGRVANAR